MASVACGGGDKPCEHTDHGMFWMHNEVDRAALRVLERVEEGRKPTDEFQTAHLIALGALSFDEPGGELSITDRGLCCIDWMKEKVK